MTHNTGSEGCVALDFDSYNLDPAFYDEMFLPDGTPREHCRELYNTLLGLTVEEVITMQERVTRSFSQEGISFKVYGDDQEEERIIPVDCLPRIVSAEDWRVLEQGLAQRLKTLNLFLDDVYNESHIIRDGVIPEDVVTECPQYRLAMRGFSPPQGAWAVICGTDVVRTNDGFHILEDNLRVPSGMSYMIANRKAIKATVRRLFRSSRVHGVERYGETLLTTLRELAPEGTTYPVIALLTPGVYNSAFYEHMFLAHELGAELVEGRDLLVEGGFVYMRTSQGLRRVDIIYRRVDDDFLDPTVFRFRLAAGCARPARRLQARQRHPGQRSRHRSRRRQERLCLRAGHDPLLPGRGAADRQRGDLPLPAPTRPGVHAGQHAGPGCEAGG